MQQKFDEISVAVSGKTPANLQLKTLDQIRPMTGAGISTQLSSNSGFH
jgi:hypothetical protein